MKKSIKGRMNGGSSKAVSENQQRNRVCRAVTDTYRKKQLARRKMGKLRGYGEGKRSAEAAQAHLKGVCVLGK